MDTKCNDNTFEIHFDANEADNYPSKAAEFFSKYIDGRFINYKTFEVSQEEKSIARSLEKIESLSRAIKLLGCVIVADRNSNGSLLQDEEKDLIIKQAAELQQMQCEEMELCKSIFIEVLYSFNYKDKFFSESIADVLNRWPASATFTKFIK